MLATGTLAVVVVGVAAGIAYLALSHTKELRYKTQNALRAGVARRGGEELAHRGVTLTSALNCTDSPGWTKRKMRVTCTSSTSDHQPVQVIGAGEGTTQEQYYTILVNGRPLVENATCLGADCRQKH
ncbi:hypothetical protein DZF91_26180 [Actinomadura logoneensis]|uniref:Uncharacterized protein n=1 Tax=Actinomadura logoneensis TaxID=2293572 RepID=A0A372JFI0_9ACTN|nr:hypothetical protein DZF91_26180 [Actinomadura logoneensis]